MFVDVDVAEPDEKSLITYVSSLYDVFPDVPSMEQSLRDSVRTAPCLRPSVCLLLQWFVVSVDYITSLYGHPCMVLGVPWRQPHRRSGLANLPSVRAVP